MECSKAKCREKYRNDQWKFLLTCSTCGAHWHNLCCEPRVNYVQLMAMFEASVAGARTGGIGHWTCSHCSRVHLEEATPAPGRTSSANPEPMEVDLGTEQLPTSQNAKAQVKNIDHVEEEIIRVSSLPPAIQVPVTPTFSPPPTAAAKTAIYETPLHLSSFQNQAHFIPEPQVSEPSLLASLFPRIKRASDYEGIFTRRGARSRATGLLKHLRSPSEPSNAQASAAQPMR